MFPNLLALHYPIHLCGLIFPFTILEQIVSVSGFLCPKTNTLFSIFFISPFSYFLYYIIFWSISMCFFSLFIFLFFTFYFAFLNFFFYFSSSSFVNIYFLLQKWHVNSAFSSSFMIFLILVFLLSLGLLPYALLNNHIHT